MLRSKDDDHFDSELNAEYEAELDSRSAGSLSTSVSLEVDAVSLIGGRGRGLSVGMDSRSVVPEPLAIETMDDDATDFFSVSGNNLKADRCEVTCTRSSDSVQIRSLK